MKYQIWIDGEPSLDRLQSFTSCVAWIDNYRMTQKKLELPCNEIIYVTEHKYDDYQSLLNDLIGLGGENIKDSENNNTWHIVGTGGGCDAILINCHNYFNEKDHYWLITDDAQAPTSIHQPITCTRYQYSDGGCYDMYFEAPSLQHIRFDKETQNLYLMKEVTDET